ncbi:MAG: Uma2 family endonuclease [Planctomycetes bacterium]|nr:Uma2 family endonuclease [Planctomycetota bacterium]
MSLADFARAEGRGGYLYELAKGVVVVVNVPRVSHGLLTQAIDDQVRVYKVAHPGVIHFLAPGSDCALRLPGLQSERHPDRALYLTPPPSDNPWDAWTPEIAIEVVSRGQEERDYGEKREEYLRAGVREYWIFDPHRRTALFLRRQGDEWSEEEKEPASVYRTALLPGFELDLAAVFTVAKDV